jgi:integrase
VSSLHKENGIWTYYGRIGGKQIHRSLQTGEHRIAVQRQKVLDEEFARSRWPVKRISWNEFVERYEAWAAPRKAPATCANERSVLKRYTEAMSPVLLSDLTRQRIEEFLTHITTQPRENGKITGPSGANSNLRFLRSVLSTAVEWKLLEENPAKGVRTLRTELAAPRILTRAEVAALLVATKKRSPEYLPLFVFYLVTGMRRNEALSLEWKDVNYETGVITVARAKGRRPRLIPMAPIARRILLSLEHHEKPFRWRPRTVTETFDNARTDAGLRNVRLHDLRKTFGTVLAQAGVNSLFIQNWMGHADDTVTREHYIGLPEETQNQLTALQAIIPAEFSVTNL